MIPLTNDPPKGEIAFGTHLGPGLSDYEQEITKPTQAFHRLQGRDRAGH